jgi:hypothetical protein
MRRITLLPIAVMLSLLGCRSGPVDPKPQEYTRLEDEAPRESTPRAAPATVTPKEAYEAFRDAVGRQDYEAVWPLLSKRTQDDYDRRAAEFEMQLKNRSDTSEGVEALLKAMGLTAEKVRASAGRGISGARMMSASMRLTSDRNPEHFKRIARSRFAREEIHDQRAKVYVIIDREIQAEPMELVREGTLWKIELESGR